MTVIKLSVPQYFGTFQNVFQDSAIIGSIPAYVTKYLLLTSKSNSLVPLVNLNRLGIRPYPTLT
jgi:hypothetical protein